MPYNGAKVQPPQVYCIKCGCHLEGLNSNTGMVGVVQVQAALAEVEGYHAVEGSLQSKQLLAEARGNLSKMNHISHIRCGDRSNPIEHASCCRATP